MSLKCGMLLLILYGHSYYIGDMNGSSRTPSIWLHPDSNRLSIRVSTIDNPDLGYNNNYQQH